METPREHDDREAPFDWRAGAPVAFVTLWCSGEDPGLDVLVRAQALRPRRDGAGWERLDLACELGADAPRERLERAFGALPEAQGSAEDCWRDVAAFVAGHVVVSPEREEFERWAAHLGGDFAAVPAGLGLCDAAALFFPGRLAQRGAALVADLVDGERASPAAVGPADVQAALAELVARLARLDDERFGVVVGLWLAAWRALLESDREAAALLERLLQLLYAPRRWSPAAPELGERAERAALPLEQVGFALDDLDPRWVEQADAFSAVAPLPPDLEQPLPFTPEDRAALDAIFREHLPASFEAERAADAGSSYRASQHEVAREVADTLGAPVRGDTRLLLVHAPTGTGKTLAYLVPALLWARRHEVRVGIATYTRALQEQAMDREVPRALAALRRAGAPAGFRITMLKGRENYLCWRALKLHVPEPGTSGEELLAYAQLVTFALTDGEGDLDRLPRRPPVTTSFERAHRAAQTDLLRQVRAQTSCCRARDDRHTCAAEGARRRAERSHLVLTNHSFALARQDFFQHVVFDECEHLHDQAHAAWSHSLDLSGAGAWIERLETGAGRRGLLRRLDRRLVPGTKSSEALALLRQKREELAAAHTELTRQVEAFVRWRAEALRERSEVDEHSLLREYAEREVGAPLVTARRRFHGAGVALEQRLAELGERLEEVAERRFARLRRALELARTELGELLEDVAAWMPIEEGQPAFKPRTFHDVEDAARGRVELAARVLLPNEYLGRFYYPRLASACFLSATTWLRGGFEAAKAYTGLDRAVEPGPDEERLPCELRTFRAPEVFDYSRVLVAVPRDAPSVSLDKEAFLGYVRDFVAQLGERTGGRILVLFTNAEDVKRVGARLEGWFRARRVPFWYQNMEGRAKEELSELFRRRRDSILLGVDTFWYGADFPGDTLEYLVIVRLPYGVPDRYHHAQCAVLGTAEQRRQIYLPRALAKFRQGFGRLMRRVSDRGCVFLLDHRVLDPRHRLFLNELPLAGIGHDEPGLARLVRGDTALCLDEAMVHMGLAKRPAPLAVERVTERVIERFEPEHDAAPDAAGEIGLDDLPF
ncbi:MAG: hypothetical protein H6828_02710 [Planctomycetes bacterium]|nr:hypothetical protein [Planctomycetota bacterium]